MEEDCHKKNIANFFDVANSTKVTNDFIPNSKTKHGYKGHGAKVFLMQMRS